MDLFGLPSPASIFEAWANGKLERETAITLLSTGYSALVASLWTSGNKSRLAKWLGIGSAERDAATAIYLSLQPAIVARNLNALSVPKGLLDPNNLARFQTEDKS